MNATANGSVKVGPADLDGYREELKQAAAEYIAAGLRITVCNGKNPQRLMGKGWQKKRLTVDQANRLIDQADWPTIGFMQGGAGGIVDAEPDSDEEREAFLELFDREPPTAANYSSGRGAHWLFAADKRLDATGAGVINYVGSNGAKLGVRVGGNGAAAHSCVPPSHHCELADKETDRWRWTGKRYEWRATIDDCGLGKLPDEVVEKLLASHAEKNKSATTNSIDVHDGALAAMRRSTRNQDDGNDGSKRLFTSACRAVEFDLTDAEAVATISAYAAIQPFPKAWTDAEIRQRIRDAEKHVERGSGVEVTNGREIEVQDDEGETKTIIVPLSMRELQASVRRITNNWPRRMHKALFIDDKKHGLGWFEKTPEVFGWLSNFGLVNWQDRKPKFVKQSEFVAELRRTTTAYDAVELLPHEPPIAKVYYRCDIPIEGDGSHLRKLLDFFRPETTIDRDLIEAAILTAFWGGPPGSRPAFVFTSTQGRGAGKSKLAESISHLAGGFLDVSAGEDISTLKQRFLSPEGLTKRVAIIDNVKSLKFSWAELEALITTPIVSGKAMYIGEMQRPNHITWMMTLNGVSLATDLAQRAVIVNLVKGKNDGTWYERLIGYIDANREAIIGDIIARLRGPRHELAKYSRWAAWEKDILSRLAEPSEAQRVILERQGEADCEQDEAGIIEDFFAEQIAGCGRDPHAGQYRLPVSLVATWYGWATNDKAKTVAISKRLRQMADEDALKRLAPDPSRQHGRCFIWTGPAADVQGESIDNWFTMKANCSADRQNRGAGYA